MEALDLVWGGRDGAANACAANTTPLMKTTKRVQFFGQTTPCTFGTEPIPFATNFWIRFPS